MNRLIGKVPLISFFISLAISLLISPALMSQKTSGIIEYEVRMDVHRRIPAEREEMKAMIPQFRSDNYQLFFNETESLYKIIIDEEAEATQQGGGRRMMFRMPGMETHLEKTSRIRTVQQEFMGKKYLIEDTLNIAPWKIGSEQMEISGYLCQMAYYTDSSNAENIQEITAWFALQLPPFNGPESYASLPGTILALDINNGERVFIARKIEFKTLQKQDIKKPDKGEKISREKFTAMMREQMEKMRNQGGGGFRRFN
ncbi:MAG: GLPGLI family protein [Cyclobacteriaceae bacterium]|nr:GLPGLI family protein [Cyclobacteriaceae bacterium]